VNKRKIQLLCCVSSLSVCSLDVHTQWEWYKFWQFATNWAPGSASVLWPGHLTTKWNILTSHMCNSIGLFLSSDHPSMHPEWHGEFPQIHSWKQSPFKCPKTKKPRETQNPSHFQTFSKRIFFCEWQSVEITERCLHAHFVLMNFVTHVCHFQDWWWTLLVQAYCAALKFELAKPFLDNKHNRLYTPTSVAVTCTKSLKLYCCKLNSQSLALKLLPWFFSKCEGGRPLSWLQCMDRNIGGTERKDVCWTFTGSEYLCSDQSSHTLFFWTFQTIF
jgi:hypothetical protein